MARVVDRWTNKDRKRSAQYGKGARWQAIWTEDGAERKKSFITKDAAEEYLTDLRHKQRSGTYVRAADGRLKVGPLLDTWVLTLVHYKPSTLATTTSDVNGTLKPYWGDKVLADIERQDVQKWVTGMGKAARTVQTLHGRFLAFLEWCVNERRIVSNPARGINLPKGNKRAHLFLNVEEVTALASAIGERYEGLIWVLATTGLRMGEVAELRVKDLDARRRRLRIDRSVVFVSGEANVGLPKNGDRRTVPVTDVAMEYLDAAAKGKQRDDLLFRTARGGQLRANNFKRRDFDQAVTTVNDAAAARLAKSEPQGVTIPAGLWVHDLRHTAASWAVQAGASVKSVQRMLGHKTAAITLDVYAGLFDQDLDDVATKIDALILGSKTRNQKTEPPQNRPTKVESAA